MQCNDYYGSFSRGRKRTVLVLVYCTHLSVHVFRFIHCWVSGVSNQLLWKIIKKQGKFGSCARVFTRQTVPRIAYSLQRMHSQMLIIPETPTRSASDPISRLTALCTYLFYPNLFLSQITIIFPEKNNQNASLTSDFQGPSIKGDQKKGRIEPANFCVCAPENCPLQGGAESWTYWATI